MIIQNLAADRASSSAGPFWRLKQSKDERLKTLLLPAFIQTRSKEMQFLISILRIIQACRENQFLCYFACQMQMHKKPI